ncbi:MAG: ATP-binding cassette domain-containing protein [Fibromonadaceae bacterium]|jgi:phospholipid/cholesterol/gamma-HCH transport system ATP-binding protein|nr:ATP-binding cassette domain-containing protein [Fibromonadaceae bacterium]
MESISIKNLKFSLRTYVKSELPRVTGKSLSGVLSKTLNEVKIANTIFMPSSVNILDGVNISLERGEMLCISGKSGAGKSSLLRVIAGLEKASDGEISLFGEPIKSNEWTALSMAQKGIGFVFQNSALISDLTVKENIAIPLLYHNMGTNEEIEQKVNRALLLMLANGFANDYPYSLSLGMRKRVAVARSWAMDAKILLLDEPTAGLDRNSRINFLSLMNNLRELYKTTIIMVVSDLQIAYDTNSKISFLMDKKLTPPMYFDEIKDNADPRIRAMAG